MSEKIIKEESEANQRIEEQETSGENGEIKSPANETKPKQKIAWILTAVIVAVVAVIGFVWIAAKRSGTNVKVENAETKEGEKSEKDSGHSESESGKEVKLDEETLASAHLVYEGVTTRPAVSLMKVTGSIESNPQQTQSVSPLVGGRIEEVYVSIGDHVTAGQTLATLLSTQIVESYGKLRESLTRVELAQKNLERIKRAENRVNILQAKAKLDEAQATLTRTRRLIELGAGAGKDLIAAETNYKTAKADYDFQSNIPLNREIQEAQGELQTAQIQALQQRQSLEALGVKVGNATADAKSVALVSLRAPLSGIVTERLIAPGGGIQAGQPIFTLSNVSTVWVTANVPEQQMARIRIGTAAEIISPALNEKINARVTYIDPQINEDTRTAKVRLAVPNPGERLRAGMFAEIGFYTGAANGEEMVVPTEAVQRIGDKTVVFVPRENEPGAFEVREIETGGEVEIYTRVKNGLEIGEKIVTKGSFTLKTQLQKGEMEEDED